MWSHRAPRPTCSGPPSPAGGRRLDEGGAVTTGLPPCVRRRAIPASSFTLASALSTGGGVAGSTTGWIAFADGSGAEPLRVVDGTGAVAVTVGAALSAGPVAAASDGRAHSRAPT